MMKNEVKELNELYGTTVISDMNNIYDENLINDDMLTKHNGQTKVNLFALNARISELSNNLSAKEDFNVHANRREYAEHIADILIADTHNGLDRDALSDDYALESFDTDRGQIIDSLINPNKVSQNNLIASFEDLYDLEEASLIETIMNEANAIKDGTKY